MNRFLTNTLILALALLVAPSAALAGDVAGDNVVVAKPSTSYELSDGRTYVTLGNRQICLTEDPQHALYRAAGDCDGACVVDSEGNATCMGSCTWVDSDGDLAFFSWAGQNEGSWKLLGGSGKWAEATGGGTWKGAGGLASGFGRNAWQGTIEME